VSTNAPQVTENSFERGRRLVVYSPRRTFYAALKPVPDAGKNNHPMRVNPQTGVPRMKLKPLLTAMVALSLASAGPAFAQRHDDRNDHRDDHRGPPARHAPPPRDHHGEQGGGPQHNFYKGDRLPTEYHNRQYVVNDWRGHHLRQPPRGYQWVQAGSDYALAAIATGIIADLIINH
jgi:Ni/Co efflux regulator RcnB